MKTYIIGDIHGCYHTFLELLFKIGISEGDSIICTGDLIDRGKFPFEVIDFFRNSDESLSRKLKISVTSVRGNHDDKYLRWLKGNNVKLSVKDGNFDDHYNFDFSTSNDLKKNIIEFFNSLCVIKHINPEITVVHAGIFPWMNHKLLSESFDKNMKILMYIRHYRDGYSSKDNPKGYTNDKNMFFDETLPMWYDFYKKQDYGGTVFFGHQPEKEPIVVKGKTNIIGLDTSAVFGNKLTAYCIETDTFHFCNTINCDI